MSTFYVTTPIYYVNDVPHAGHAYTTLAADVLSRYWKETLGETNVFFLTGTDEHGQKVQQAAEEKGLSPKEYSDLVAPRFQEAWKLLNIRYDYFIRTTDRKHEQVVQEVLRKIYDAGYIYKGTYKGFYCVGCEKFLTETEIVDGKCPLHPNRKPVYQEEDNYFLKLGRLSRSVLEKFKKGAYQILPGEREREILSRLNRGVEDISISRADVAWGVPIPWDKKQTAYVWVDALINYYSATRILQGKAGFWPADLHLIGKDILWFHSVVWQAILIAAGIELPRTIFAHGYFTVNGQKMSKSLGNVISPQGLINRYGVDGARYLLISAYPFGSDGDISFKRFDVKYHSNLANGLGNLVSRVAKLCETSGLAFESDPPVGFRSQVKRHFEAYRFDLALEEIWKTIARLDVSIERRRPWGLPVKRLRPVLTELVAQIRRLGYELRPFLPQTASTILHQFSGPTIVAAPPLFPRLSPA